MHSKFSFIYYICQEEDGVYYCRCELTSFHADEISHFCNILKIYSQASGDCSAISMSLFISPQVREMSFSQGRNHPLSPNRHAVKRPYFLKCKYSTQTNMFGACYLTFQSELAWVGQTGVSPIYRNVGQNRKV